MKRKILGLLIALTLAVSATACTDTGTFESSEESVSKESQTGKESADAGASQESNGAETGQETAPDGKTQGAEYRILYAGYDSGLCYGLDEKGNKVSEYHYNELKENLKKAGKDYSDAVLSVVGDGVYFLYRYEPAGNRYAYRVYAVDASSLEVNPLWTADEGWWLESLDYYQGKLYLTAYGENYQKTKEYVFEKDSDAFSFQVQKSPYAQVLENCNGYELSLYFYNGGDRGGSCCASRLMDEAGYVIGYHENAYYQITKDGQISLMEKMPKKHVYLRAYDSKGAIYSTDDEETGQYGLFCLNLQSGETKPLFSITQNSTFQAYYDGKLYYSTSLKEDLVRVKNSVWQYDVISGKEIKLYEAETIPGATDLQPGVSYFRIIDGEIYFVNLVGTEERWIRAKVDGETARLEDTLLTVSTKGMFQYGTVTFETYEGKCKFCGTTLERYYGEAFQLDAKYSDKADLINQVLRGVILNTVASYQDSDLVQSDADCEEHLEYPIMYCETVEDEVSDVRIFQDQYLVVDCSGYWYGGGAHGYPGMTQYVFDLSSGARLSLKDFYKDSEESFKKLVAEKTKEDYLSYEEDMSPYFSDDKENIYKEAYEMASLEKSEILFEEDGIYVVYAPYVMGPYASGFIEIFISYQELLGRPRL